MSSDPRIRYRPHLDATPEAELEVLARVYRFLTQTLENRKATTSGGYADTKGGEIDQSRTPSGSGGSSATDRRGDGSDKPSKRTKDVNIE
jgi:hypothetical protein